MIYIVYRHGSNACNQSMCQTMALCLVEADSPKEARSVAEEYHIFYHNQWAEVLPAKRRRKDSDVIENSLDNHYYRNDPNVIRHPQVVATVEPQFTY